MSNDVERLECRSLLSAYVVTDLGTLGGPTSYANAVNDAGQVTGQADLISGGHRAFIYSAGAMKSLGTLGGYSSVGYGINKYGQVAGTSTDAAGHTRAFEFVNGAMKNLGTLSGHSTSDGYAINDAADVAGDSFGSDFDSGRGYIYHAGVMKSVGTPAGSPGSHAYGINNTGGAVGNTTISSGATRGFVYQSGSIKSVGTLPGGTFSHLYGINDKGQAVGEGDNSSHATHAIFYSGGVLRDLGTLSGGSYSHSYGLNESGTVVGQSKTSSGALHATVWRNAGAPADLNTLDNSDSGWTLTTATAVSDNGMIVGYGSSRSGSTRAFLLTPTSGATISGTVWKDADRDGVRDSGEKPFAGTKLFIDADKDGKLDAGEKIATSDASGNYFFTGLSAGTYRVRAIAPTGYRSTSPSASYFDVTLSTTQHTLSKNFLVG